MYYSNESADINGKSGKAMNVKITPKSQNKGDNIGSSPEDDEAEGDDDENSFRKLIESMVTTYQQLSSDHFYGLKSYHSHIPKEWKWDLVNGYLAECVAFEKIRTLMWKLDSNIEIDQLSWDALSNIQLLFQSHIDEKESQMDTTPQSEIFLLSNLPDQKLFPNPIWDVVSTSSTEHKCMIRDYFTVFTMDITNIFGPVKANFLNQGRVICQDIIQGCVMYQFTIYKNRMERRIFDRGKSDDKFCYK